MARDIKNLMECTALALAFVRAVKDSLADGKLSVGDLWNLRGVVTKIQPALDNIAAVPAELKDMDAVENEQWRVYVRGELETMGVSDKVEEMTDWVLGFADDIADCPLLQDSTM